MLSAAAIASASEAKWRVPQKERVVEVELVIAKNKNNGRDDVFMCARAVTSSNSNGAVPYFTRHYLNFPRALKFKLESNCQSKCHGTL